MKQIIHKYPNGSILYKYYKNHLGQSNGIGIGYHSNGSLSCKTNYLNGKLFGISNRYDKNAKPTQITYHL